MTPGEVLPARELYADLLLGAERYAEGLKQYERVLKRSPNRLNALIGASRAAKGAGDDAIADAYMAKAKEQAKLGDKRRAGLEQR